MPYKNKEDRLECRRRWYRNNKESEKNHIYRRRREINEWFKKYKSSLKCIRCGENFPDCLDFHHKGKRDILIPVLVRSGYSIERIMEEIKKCEVLCANCHRKEHSKKNKNN